MSDDLSDAAIDSALTGAFGRPYRFFESIDSTNTSAVAWAEEGATEGSLVVANHQTHGKGRWGRAWLSQTGRLLQLSLVLRPMIEPENLGLLTLALGVAVAEGLERASGLDARLKWPNDVLIGDRKVCGMLVETALRGSKVAYAIAGIGVNVSWAQEELPEAIAATATSIATEVERTGGGRVPERASLLAALMDAIHARYAELKSGDSDPLRAAAAERSTILGRDVTIRFASGATTTGRALRIGDSGALVIEQQGKEVAVEVGEVAQVRPA